MTTLAYPHLRSGQTLPRLEDTRPFKAVLIIDDDVTSQWQADVSDWLVRSGCLYMMAWGRKCSEWDDSVDTANLEAFDYKEIPEESSVMTTWHEQDSLLETFWFCQHSAFHPIVELEHTLIIDISSNERRDKVLHDFRSAQGT